MERLTPIDAEILSTENDRSAAHGISIGVFDGPEPSFDDLCDLVAERVKLVPRYRQRLVEVPFGMARPVWVDDPHFSIDFHVRHTALPRRKKADALAMLVSRLLSQRLDRGKPLWELWMVSGLKDGHWALVSKVHYAVIDGVSGTDLFGLLHDDIVPISKGDTFTAKPLPTPARLASDAVTENMFNPFEAMRTAQDLMVQPLRTFRRGVGSALAGARRSEFGASSGPHRRWQRLRVPLDDVRDVRKLHDCTTTDVILAAITGGIRHFLLEHGERVPAELSTLLPLSVASEATGFTHDVTALLARLPVGNDSPIHRLDIISDQTALSAASEGAIAGDSLRRQEHFSTPTVMAMGVRATLLEAHRKGRGRVDTVTINMPGPSETQTVLGRELLKAYPVVPLVANVRMAFAVMSYRNDLSFGITGDWDTTPHLGLVADGIRSTIQDLRS